MHEHNPECRHLLASLSDYVDGDVSESLCAEIEKHLQECENCQVVVNTLRKTVDLYRNVDETETVPASVMQRLYMRLNLDDFMAH
jgi:predicted anti-sigma-YlaC factor YlaD